ncbi:hypothetical protein JCM8547_005206 [Rhodosporidiobolus lusitaniae]
MAAPSSSPHPSSKNLPQLPAVDRSPFVPVRKHKPSTSPPPSPVLSAAPARLTRSTAAQELASTSGSGGGGRSLAPLGSSHAHNLPAFSVHSPPRKTASPAPVSLDTFSPTSSLLPPPSSAPRIRAKVTPAAAPRRKALPGTERADIPTSQPTAGFSPTKRVPPPPSFSSSTSTPQPRSIGTYGAFPAMSAVPENGELSDLQGGFSGLGLASPFGVGTSRRARQGRAGGGRENVLVCVRVRPPAAKLAAAAATIDEMAWKVDATNGKLVQHAGGPEYLFDSVVTGSENSAVYEDAGRDLVLDTMEGFDAVVFAYGQTASGKTFTLSGNAANPGIIPLAVSDIFSYIHDHPEKEFLLRASYLEIYNETLKDLLDPTSGPVKIRQDEKKRFFVHPLREEVVTSEAQVAALLKRGSENRHVGSTDFNERSSRSHSVFQMTIESRDDPSAKSSILSSASSPFEAPRTPNAPLLQSGTDGVVRMSRLSLIDLAGSEQATSQLERRSEGAFINRSLLTLEKVIASLTSEAKQKPHVPYRDSKLTQILQPSLSGDARVAVIATMNPSPVAVEETKSTLKFAQRIKKVVLKAVQHEIVDDKALLIKYRSHIAMLEAQLNSTLANNVSAPSTPSQADFEADRVRSDKQAERVRGLEQQVEEFRSLFLTSHNMEQRRQSALPPRPVSPVKMSRPFSPGASSDEDAAALHDKLLELRDEINAIQDERDELLARVSALEDERLNALQRDAAASESDKETRIAELTRENQELMVLVRNVDGEGELKRQEKKFQRQLDKCKVYEEGLEASLAAERKRVAQFERFILQHLVAQTDVLAGRRSSSALAPPSALSQSPSFAGFVPLLAESPDLAAISPDFVELDDLPFSSQAKDTIKRSGSRLFG